MLLFGRRDKEGPVTVYSYEEEPQKEESQETVAEEITTSCAWCLKDAGLPMGNGSHGICLTHAGTIRAQAAERRRLRGRQ